jgi:hypothetical protein
MPCKNSIRNLELKKEEVRPYYEEFWDSYDPAIYLSILENPHDKTSNDFDKELPLSCENKNQELLIILKVL